MGERALIIKTGLEPKISGPTEVNIVQSRIKFGDGYTLISSPNPGGSLYVVEFGDITLFSKWKPGVQNLSASNAFPSELMYGSAGTYVRNEWMNSMGAPTDAKLKVDFNFVYDTEIHTVTWWEISI